MGSVIVAEGSGTCGVAEIVEPCVVTGATVDGPDSVEAAPVVAVCGLRESAVRGSAVLEPSVRRTNATSLLVHVGDLLRA